MWDTGTGAHTVLRQMVAETLTIPVEDVGVVIRDTDAVGFESGPGGSRVTYTSGQSTMGAAEDLKEQLTVLAAEYMGASADTVSLQAGQFQANDGGRAMPLKDVAAQAVAALGDDLTAEKTYTSPPSHYTSYCAQVAEVEVDAETGEVKVTRFITAHDVGTVLNPLFHQGQIEGGVIQGLGYALMEEMETEEGRIANLSLGDYKIPTIKDVPELVTVLLEPGGGPAPFESKGIGESSNTPVAAAIANAVQDAIGVPVLELPLTAERVLRAMRG